jgi:hypothetical protein
MRNDWSVFKNVVQSWTVRVKPASPAALAAFLDTVRRAGQDTGVYRREAMDEAQDGWAADSSSRVLETSRIAVFDGNGALTERDTSCLYATPGGGLRMKHFAPLEVMWFPRPSWFEVSILTTTDLWWPRFFADGAPWNPVVDNRALAHRHTPRLNRFLATVRAEALRIGGIWESDPDLSLPWLYDQLDDQLLIRLGDGVPPDAAPHRLVIAPADRRNRWQTPGSRSRGPLLQWQVEIPATSTAEWREFLDFVWIAGTDTGIWEEHLGSVLSRLAVFDEHGEVAERTVACFADLPGKRGEPHSGTTWVSTGASEQPGLLTISIWSDICLPRVQDLDGAAVDNHVLAARNAARLNDFLTWVRDAAVERGGAWRVSVDKSDPWAIDQLDERHLIRIDP